MLGYGARMRYVAFLRAINVGSRRLKMDLLRDVFTEAGLENVATHIASGNVIFEASSPPLSGDLERAFERRIGFHSAVFLRSSDGIRSVLDHVPWQDGDGTVGVSFLPGEPDPADARALESRASAPEQIVVSGTEVYFLSAGRGTPTMHKEAVTVKILGVTTTRRGLSTIEQIYDRFLLPT